MKCQRAEDASAGRQQAVQGIRHTKEQPSLADFLAVRGGQLGLHLKFKQRQACVRWQSEGGAQGSGAAKRILVDASRVAALEIGGMENWVGWRSFAARYGWVRWWGASAGN